MADASTTTAFKQNSRTSRIVYATQPPVSGIYDTDIPTSPAYARALINFESNNEGTGIAPRPGIEQIDLYDLNITDYKAPLTKAVLSDVVFKTYNSSDINNNTPFISKTKRLVLDSISDNLIDLVYIQGNKIFKDRLIYTNDVTAPQYKITGSAEGHTVGAIPVRFNNKLIYTTAFETNDLYYLGKTFSTTEYSSKVPCLLKHAVNADISFDLNSSNEAIESYFNDSRFFIEPKTLTPTQATSWGFNMLSKNPYTFESTVKEGAETINTLGLLPYVGDKVVLNTLKNTPYTYKLISEIGSEGIYAIKAQYKQVYTDQWNEITGTLKKGLNADAVKNYSFIFTSPVDSLVMRLSFYKKSELPLSTQYLEMSKTEWEGTKLDDKAIYSHKDEFGNIFYYKADLNDADSKIITYYPEASDEEEEALFKEGYRSILTFPVAFNYTRTVNGSQDLINYELCSAKGMCYWRNRLILWGVDNGAPVLFFSELNDPSYFPYPNNISVLPEPIIKAVPFQDSLLVFTKTQVWQITLNADGLTWTETCLQKNLKIDEKDSHLIIPLSNMVFFKSDLFYYMLVPSSKGTGTLVLATIYKPVEKTLRNIDYDIKHTIDLLYDSTKIVSFKNPIDLEDSTYYTINAYLDYDTIRIVYSTLLTVGLDKEYQVVYNYCLNYNTTSRVWTLYTFETNSIPNLAEVNSLNKGIWEDLLNYSTETNVVFDNSKVCLSKSKLLALESETVCDKLNTVPVEDIETYDNTLTNLSYYNNSFYYQTFKIDNKLENTDNLIRSIPVEYMITGSYSPIGFSYFRRGVYISTEVNTGAIAFIRIDLEEPIIEDDLLVYNIGDNLNGYTFYSDVLCTEKYIPLQDYKLYYGAHPGVKILDLGYPSGPMNINYTKIGEIQGRAYYSILPCYETKTAAKPPHYIQNYQYADTGPLDLNSSLYKKFRNYYIDVINLSDSDLDFYIEFNVDNNLKVPLYTGSVGVINGTYDITYDLNEDSKQTVYGSVKGLKDGLEYTINGTTWDTPYIARLKSIVTCKGLRPGLKIYSKNQTPYEILNTTWVYRYKNAR